MKFPNEPNLTSENYASRDKSPRAPKPRAPFPAILKVRI